MQAREVEEEEEEGMAMVDRHALEDSPYPKDTLAVWVKGTCAQEVEQRVALSKVEGVSGKLVEEELEYEVEWGEEECGWQLCGPEVASILEEGSGWCHLAGEVEQVEERGEIEEWGKGKGVLRVGGIQL